MQRYSIPAGNADMIFLVVTVRYDDGSRHSTDSGSMCGRLQSGPEPPFRMMLSKTLCHVQQQVGKAHMGRTYHDCRQLFWGL